MLRQIPLGNHGELLLTNNNHMADTIAVHTVGDTEKKVYEIGYLLVSSVPPEKVADIVTTLKSTLSKKEAVIISEENPELISLAYTMIKKIGTVNHRFDQGYFGWIKFEVSGKEIEEIKKGFEMHPDMLRLLLIITVRDNTYLGKKAVATPTLVNSMNATGIASEGISGEVGGTETLPIPGLDIKGDVKPAPASVEEMDKSIDEMVKGA